MANSKASSRARPDAWGRGEGGTRPLDRAGQDRPQAFDCASTSTRSRSIVVSLWRRPSCPPSIHRFVIVALREAAWARNPRGNQTCVQQQKPPPILKRRLKLARPCCTSQLHVGTPRCDRAPDHSMPPKNRRVYACDFLQLTMAQGKTSCSNA
jgi:hypothetical protein